MNRLFREALAAGKRVRSDTRIGSRSVSMSSVAVGLAQETLGDLSGKRVIVIGAGETGELTARALTEQGVRSVFVANRHYDRAIGLAQRFGGQAVRFDALPDELEHADIVLSSTSSPHHIIERDGLAAVMERRGGRPLLAIDIAVPRDIDPAVAELEGVHLRDVDDLQRVVERNVSGREAETHHANALIDRELERFERWLATLDVVPTITALHERGEAIARQVLEENAGRWQSLTDADRERLGLMASTIVKRLLHQPVRRLKDADEGQRTYAYVQALRELFGLEEELLSSFDSAAAELGARDEEATPEGAAVTPIRKARRRKRA
jgi:glutamyl-tRNA reductase